jgi:hypothetical protein
MNACSDPDRRMGAYNEVEDAHCTWLKTNIEWMNLVILHQDMVVSRRRPLSENADRHRDPVHEFVDEISIPG